MGNLVAQVMEHQHFEEEKLAELPHAKAGEEYELICRGQVLGEHREREWEEANPLVGWEEGVAQWEEVYPHSSKVPN